MLDAERYFKMRGKDKKSRLWVNIRNDKSGVGLTSKENIEK